MLNKPHFIWLIPSLRTKDEKGGNVRIQIRTNWEKWKVCKNMGIICESLNEKVCTSSGQNSQRVNQPDRLKHVSVWTEKKILTIDWLIYENIHFYWNIYIWYVQIRRWKGRKRWRRWRTRLSCKLFESRVVMCVFVCTSEWRWVNSIHKERELWYWRTLKIGITGRWFSERCWRFNWNGKNVGHIFWVVCVSI